jgi:hypothetical protein
MFVPRRFAVNLARANTRNGSAETRREPAAWGPA